MQVCTVFARALAGAATLAMASAAVAQGGTAPRVERVTDALAAVEAAKQGAPAARADGYAEIERLPDWSGVWNPDWSLLFGGGGGRTPPPQPKLEAAAQAQLEAFRAKQAAEGV